MHIPENIKYTKDHEWIKIEGNIGTVGITDFAQRELGDIVYVEIDKSKSELNKEEIFGTVEAVKTVSDLFMPMSGKIIEVNADLENAPEKINKEPYGKGWMIKIALSNTSEANELLSAAQYSELVSAQ